jgi:T-complex protein 1 subunit beta
LGYLWDKVERAAASNERGSQRGEGRNRQTGTVAFIQSSFVGAIAVADLVKTTLGSRGMDKILVPIAAGPKNKNITVTNDGATILRSMHVDNPAAKILIDISKTQDEEVGDGTTTVAVLAGELLREGEKLIHMRFHPQTIIQGWRMARDAARAKLLSLARDHSSDQEKFK